MFLDENSLKIRFLDKKHHCPGFLAPFVAARLQASRQRIIYFFVFFQKKIRQLTHRSFNLEKKKKIKDQGTRVWANRPICRQALFLKVHARPPRLDNNNPKHIYIYIFWRSNI